MKPSIPARHAAPRSLPAPEDEKLGHLLRHLDLVTTAVAESAAEQPKLFWEASEYRVAKFRKLAAAKARYEQVKADCELAIRRTARDNGDKVTEGEVKALLLVEPAVREASAKLDAAEAEEEASKQLLVAYTQRNGCIKVIGDLTGAERAMSKIVEGNASAIRDSRRKLEEKYGRD